MTPDRADFFSTLDFGLLKVRSMACLEALGVEGGVSWMCSKFNTINWISLNRADDGKLCCGVK